MIIFDPVDYLFRESTLAAGGVPVLFPAEVTSSETLDLSRLEQYITEKTRMICLCNPHNPLGLVYSEEDLRHILTLANTHDLWIMNDEIWSDIVYKERPFTSILSLGKELNRKTLSVFGFSKSFGIAGLRAGCLYAHDSKIFERLSEQAEVRTTAGGITSLSQIAGMTCLDSCGYWLDAFLEHLSANRDYAYERINAMNNISCRKTSGNLPDVHRYHTDGNGFGNFRTETSQ